MVQYRFELDHLPPSVNSMYRVYNKRVYKSAKAREFQKNFKKHIEDMGCTKLTGDLRLIVTFYVKVNNKDLDNMLKALIDSMQGIVFDNDKSITEINCKKIHGSGILFNTTEVIIEEISPDLLSPSQI